MLLSICKAHIINISKFQLYSLKLTKKIKMYILLATIWFIISLPLPWIIDNPLVSESSFYTILGIIGIMSIPFVMLGMAWSLKPELTT